MYILRVVSLVIIALICCSKLTFSQDSELEGTWIKIKPDTPLGGYSIKFTFTGDKFYLRKGVYVDYIDPNDTCRKNRGWIDFAAGTCSFNEGKIMLSGIWTDSSYVNKQVFGCTNLGLFEESYYYSRNNDTLVFNKNEAVFDESKKYQHVYDLLVFVKQ